MVVSRNPVVVGTPGLGDSIPSPHSGSSHADAAPRTRVSAGDPTGPPLVAKGALAAARDLAMFTTTYGWGLRRREAARLETHDWRRQAKLPEFGDYAGWLSAGANRLVRGSRRSGGW
ncbi:hypothetical protein ACFZDK_34785 [Streptomyces sp. NPDC007901]|uniref:hypothetical protein n=1 Tax=Streptomyces sp. NPDC007901 TaxID=3364785 RepID=UPI0036E085C2